MAYLKPALFARRVFNPVALRFGLSGTQALVVPRRRSGAPQQVPVIPLEYEGSQYLVSTRGESDWVRNLRAADGRAELRGRNSAEPFRAVEIPVAERPPLIAAYRTLAGRSVAGYFTKLPDPADHPVFRLGPDRG